VPGLQRGKYGTGNGVREKVEVKAEVE